jgi:hypothetical protein
MKGALGVALSAIAGWVSYFLSLGFVLRPGAEGFHFFAMFGAISGFGVGSVVASRVKGLGLVQLAILMAVNLFVGSGAALIYMSLVSMGDDCWTLRSFFIPTFGYVFLPRPSASSCRHHICSFIRLISWHQTEWDSVQHHGVTPPSGRSLSTC